MDPGVRLSGALSGPVPSGSAARPRRLTCLFKAKINFPSVLLDPEFSHSDPDRWETPHHQQTQVRDNYGPPAQIPEPACPPPRVEEHRPTVEPGAGAGSEAAAPPGPWAQTAE